VAIVNASSPMADPTPYTPNYSFSGFQAVRPTTPLPADEVDTEFARLKLASGQAVDAIKQVRRSDGQLKNKIVTLDSLSKTLRDAIFGADITPVAPEMSFWNVIDFGAVADYDPDAPTSSTDNTAAFQAAFDEASAHGGTVFIPAGGYYFAQASASLDPGVGGFSVIGEYGCSILYFHEGTGSGGGVDAKELIYNDERDSNKSFLFFYGVTFKGTFGAAGRTGQQGGTAAFLDHYDELKFSYCRWENLTWCAIDTHFNGSFSADHCFLRDVAGDGIRQRESKYGVITNCYFQRLGDDAISWHGGAYVADYDPDDGSPRREGLVVTGNTFRDTSACITALGARQLIVANNNANRYRTYFVFVATTPSGFNEGTHPTANIKIVDNIALNLITSSGGYIIIGAGTPRGAVSTSDVVPGMPQSDGSFEYIWDHQNADYTDTADAFPPIENIDVSGNIFARTLPLVANYSDWGYGMPASPTYGADLALTADILRPAAGVNVAIGKTTVIKNNIIKHTDDAIFLVAQANVYPAIDAGQITGNTVFDFTNSGIRLSGASGRYVEALLTGNIINGDIYRQSSNSNSDGTYDNGFAQPRALDLGTSYGATVRDNRISNVAQIIENADRHDCSGNMVMADIVALGSDPANKGVRNLVAPELGFRYVNVDCDPTSATYGQIKDWMVPAATAQPSTGLYVKGHYTANSNISYDGIDVVVGWKRLTTGSNHVAGTDWLQDVQDPRAYLQIFDGWSISALADGASTTTTIAVPGAKLGDFVDISMQADVQGLALTGYVSAADTVTAVASNLTGSPVTVAATVRASVRPRTYG
jgi:hypothetical protein